MSKLRDDLYQRLHGFQPLKRSYKKQGQSDWYYLDPRGASTVGSMKQIDVSNENAINPQINNILADDMAKNPNDYYIWRTRQDDKVRSKHAEREGKIFNKHIPPVDGNPGEDYNCRCWAEPYKPQKVEKLGITAKVDLSGLPQYAENDKSGIKSDATFLKADINDKELLELMANNLLETEKMKNYIYLDKFGHITSGVGALLDDEKAFKSVPWMIGNRLATKNEVDAAYNMFVYKRFAKDKRGKYIYHNRLAESFINDSPLRVSKEYMIHKMMKHLQEDLKRAKSKREDFDTYPVPLKLIVLDFYYNKGSFYNQPGLPQALNERNAKLFQEKMMRNMEDRDKWTKKQFTLIPKSFWNSY